ncbi:MAG: hypothetical protein ACLQBA_00055, partial [Candidatus Binataceae bacterium]
SPQAGYLGVIPAPVDLWATHPTPVQRIDFYDSRSFYPTRSSDGARIAATQFLNNLQDIAFSF